MVYRRAIVWRKAVRLAEIACREAAALPPRERFTMGAQVTRSALSVACNIAEGWGRESRKEKAQFLAIAQGSLDELATQLHLCARLRWMPEEPLAEMRDLHDEVGRMLTALRRSLRQGRPAPVAPASSS